MNWGRSKITSIIIALLSFIITGSSIADEGDFQWQKTFGGTRNDWGRSVQQTTDGGYIIAGYTETGYNAYLVKTNSDGDVVWEKTFGGSTADWAQSVQQTTDGGYIISGVTTSDAAGGSGLYLVKTNSDGDLQWQKTFGGSSGEGGYSVQQTSDGGYIITGFTSSYGSGGNDVYLVKTNSNGDLLWEKTFGGSSSDWGYSVQETSDNGYIISGETSSYGSGGSDVYLVKTSSTGEIQWDKTFGGSDGDRGYSVQQTTDGGYIISGFTYSYGVGGYDIYLVKANSDGDLQWEKTFGGTSDEVGYSVQQTSDGGYIITGNTGSYSDTDVYVVKANSDGDLQWEYTFGGTAFDEGESVQQTSDGGYIIAGSTRSTESGYADVYLLKISDNLPPTVAYELLASSGNESVSLVTLAVTLPVSSEVVTVGYSVTGGTATGGGVDYTLSSGALTFSPGDKSEDISLTIVDDSLDEIGETIIVTLSDPVNAGLGLKTTHTFTIVDDDVAVEPEIEWEQTLGSGYGRSVQQTSDGGYIVVGGSLLLKTDLDGEMLWKRSSGCDGQSVQQTSDGGYIVAGFVYSEESSYDVCLVKTNSNGEELWKNTFGSSNIAYGYSVEQTSDGGYIIVGYTTSYGSGDYDVYLVKTDSNGGLQWERTFDGGIDDRGYSVQQTTDGGYIITGYTWSSGSVGDDVYLVKTDSNGDLIWQKNFNGPFDSSYECGYSVQQTFDGGYIITGYTEYSINNRCIFLLKTNSYGNLLWDRTFGGSLADSYSYSVQQTPDSGYIIVGSKENWGSSSGPNVYLVKTNANGELQWEKTLNRSINDRGYSVQQTSDGGYIVAGSTIANDGSTIEVYLIKVSSAELTGLIGEFTGPVGTPDGYVDIWDLMYFADRWHTTPSDANWDPICDLSGSGGTSDAYIDIWDLMVFADHWHEGEPP